MLELVLPLLLSLSILSLIEAIGMRWRTDEKIDSDIQRLRKKILKALLLSDAWNRTENQSEVAFNQKFHAV